MQNEPSIHIFHVYSLKINHFGKVIVVVFVMCVIFWNITLSLYKKIDLFAQYWKYGDESVKIITCIDDERSGATRSSLPIFAILLWTLTSAFSSFDSRSVCRKPKSCSPDKLSASLSDVTSLESTIKMPKIQGILFGYKWEEIADTQGSISTQNICQEYVQ